MEKMVYIVTHAKDDMERAAIPFKLAGGAIAMDVEPAVYLQAEGVRLATKGYLTDSNEKEKEIKNLMNTYLSAGYKFYLCSPCLKDRNIKDEDLIEGAIPVGAAKLTEDALKAKNILSY